jgi:hypothetical protein
MAEKYSFTKSFAIDDFNVISEVKHHLDSGRMVIVAAWGKEERFDVYLEPQIGGDPPLLRLAVAVSSQLPHTALRLPQR